MHQIENRIFQNQPTRYQSPVKKNAQQHNQQNQQMIVAKYAYYAKDQIGDGAFSQVYKGVNRENGEIVAIKVINMKKLDSSVKLYLLQNEIYSLQKMDNMNVVKVYNIYQSNSFTYIVTEYCEEGDLRDVIKQYKKIEEQVALKILKHIINGYKECMDKKIIHRDFKPENILIKQNIPKLSDFGFAADKETISKEKHFNVGTPHYMCPYSILQNEYSTQSDFWGIGMIYYEMLYGQHPWNIDKKISDWNQFAKCILEQKLTFPNDVKVSKKSKDFIMKCLQKNKLQRMSKYEFLNHDLLIEKRIQNIQEKEEKAEKQSFFDKIGQFFDKMNCYNGIENCYNEIQE